MNELLTALRSDAEFLLTFLAACGAFVAFAIGLLQYRTAQLWRRKEFLGNEVKTLLADATVRNTLLMIDWSSRRIPFDPAAERSSWPKVTREIQVLALEPHTIRIPAPRSPGDRPRRYSDLEASIRDTYDAFLDGLERLSAFVEAGLFRAQELEPHFRYWFRDMTRPDGAPEDLRWRLALLAYVDFYDFRGVQSLLRPLVGDVRVGGEVWTRLRAADPALAASLETACGRALGDPTLLGAPQPNERRPS